MSHSFTIRFKGLSNVLKSDISACAPFIPTEQPAFEKNFIALWDTGATGSVINQRIVDDLALEPVGMTKVRHPHGEAEAEVYLVALKLPNNLVFPSLPVTKGVLAGIDVLIGMDIIMQGDLAITHFRKKTTFSFRYPSSECIDFLAANSPPV